MRKILILIFSALALNACNSGGSGGNSGVNPNPAFIGGGGCVANSLQFSNGTLYASCLPIENYWNSNNYGAVLSTSSIGQNNWNNLVQDNTGNVDGYFIDNISGAYYSYVINTNQNDDFTPPTAVYNSNGLLIGSAPGVSDVPGGVAANAITAQNGILYFLGDISSWQTPATNFGSPWAQMLAYPFVDSFGIAAGTVDTAGGTYVLGNCGGIHYLAAGSNSWNDYTTLNSVPYLYPLNVNGDTTGNCAVGTDGAYSDNYNASMVVANNQLYILLSDTNGGASMFYTLPAVTQANPSPFNTTQNGGQVTPDWANQSFYSALTADNFGHLWAAQLADNLGDMQVVQLPLN